LNQGNGKFHYRTEFGQFGGDTNLVVGDFNGDGKLDVATVDPAQGSFQVFLGKGDGTFKRIQSDDRLIAGASVITTADFNNDGILDIMIVTGAGPTAILLGNPDGTFQTPTNVTTIAAGCGSGATFAVDDFNRDGNTDLAFCAIATNGAGRMYVMLGNGDGTFKHPVYYPTGTVNGNPFRFTEGDFNSDGKTDFLVSSSPGFNQFQCTVLFGKGDGSFQGYRTVKLPVGSWGEVGITAGDFNSDGLLDFEFGTPGGGAGVYLQKLSLSPTK